MDTSTKTRKPRVDKPFKNTRKIRTFLENNPDASPEEVKEYRKYLKHKYVTIHRYCKLHPEYNQEVILNDLPPNLEELKNFKLKMWVKSHPVIVNE